MPQFLTPLFWLAAMGVALPVLIHLVRRERSPRFSFSSLRFLRPASRRSIRYLKIRNPWLLLLRALFLLILIAAFARPYIRRPDALAAEPFAATSTAILLDNSYSMVIGGGFEKAVQEARGCVSRMNPQDESAVIVFSDSPTVAAPFSRAAPVLNGLLSGVEPSFRTTDYVAALRLADKMLVDRIGNKKRIVLITDLQRSGFRMEDPFKLSSGIQLELMQIPTRQGSPIFVTGAALEVSDVAGKREAKISARTVRLNKETTAGRMELLLNGNRKVAQEVKFEAENAKVAEFTLSDWPEGNVRCEFQTGSSQFYFVSGGKPKEQVLIIEGPAPLRVGKSPAYFLARALTAGSGDYFRVTAATVEQSQELLLRNYRVIFLAGIESIPASLRSRLITAVKEGTGLVISPGISLAMDQYNSSFADLTPGILTSRVGREREPAGVLGNIRTRHPIFKLFSDSGTGNFLASRFQAYYAINPVESAQVLARFDDGNPALLERAVDRGRVLLFAATLDGSWTDLPLNPIYVPFVHQIALYAGAIATPRTWFWVGEQMTFAEGNSSSGLGSKAPLAYVRMPEKPNEELPIRDPVFTFTRPGLYTFRSNEQQDYRAANVKPEELELDLLNAEEFISRLKAPSGEDGGVREGAKAVAGMQKSDLDLGSYVLGLALLLFLVELWAGGRLSRQRVSG